MGWLVRGGGGVLRGAWRDAWSTCLQRIDEWLQEICAPRLKNASNDKRGKSVKYDMDFQRTFMPTHHYLLSIMQLGTPSYIPSHFLSDIHQHTTH